jgi:hypothetical protein
MESTRWSGGQAQRLVVASTVKFLSAFWMKDEKRKRLKLEQIEDIMGNRVNVDEWPEGNWKIEVTTTWRSGKQSRQGNQASNQSE